MRVCWEEAAAWPSDPQSGVLRIEWQLFKITTGGSLALWQSGQVTANASAMTASGEVALSLSSRLLGLSSGSRYHLQLRSRNRAGLTSAWAQTGVVGVDFSAPLTASAKVATCPLSGCNTNLNNPVGSGDDLLPRYQFNTSAVRIRWAGFVDAESSVASCVAAVAPYGDASPPLSNASAWLLVPRCHEAGEALISGLTLGPWRPLTLSGCTQ